VNFFNKKDITNCITNLQEKATSSIKKSSDISCITKEQAKKSYH